MTVTPHFDFNLIIFGSSVAALRLSEKAYRVLVPKTGKQLAGATRDGVDPRGAALIVTIGIT